MKLFSIGSEDDSYVYRHEVIAQDEQQARDKYSAVHPSRTIYDVYEIISDNHGFYPVGQIERD